jgi:DNA repair photolyase
MMKITEKHSKTILSPSQIYDYVINPYVGCQHACSYCYARFMKRFSGHREPWGEFVDVKINAAELLLREIQRKKQGNVWVSGVCDPYQPLEAKYRLTRQCLEILIRNDWPVVIQTRAPLVLRDLDILKEAQSLQVGLSIPTANDDIRKIFEPEAPSIAERLRTVAELRRHGLTTYVMIAPLLPDAVKLVGLLEGKVDYILVDRLNYHYADWIYAKYGWDEKKSDGYFEMTGSMIAAECRKRGMDCRSAH